MKNFNSFQGSDAISVTVLKRVKFAPCQYYSTPSIWTTPSIYDGPHHLYLSSLFVSSLCTRHFVPIFWAYICMRCWCFFIKCAMNRVFVVLHSERKERICVTSQKKNFTKKFLTGSVNPCMIQIKGFHCCKVIKLLGQLCINRCHYEHG